jgi:protein-tyrosine phosphatase
MDTIYNFRDFGGYKTQNGQIIKQGLLYRSASLAQASASDLKTLSTLGIKTVFDLRTRREKSSRPDRLPGEGNIQAIHLPIKVKQHNEAGFILQLGSLLFGEGRKLNYSNGLQKSYREYVTNFRLEFGKIIKLAADSRNLPLLIHCTAGKDRTGFACAMLQLALNMPPELVMQDYLLSNNHLHEFKEQMLNNLKAFFMFGVSRQKILPLFEARREYLEAALDQIKHDYGAVERYLETGLGISAEDRLNLNRVLLE